MDMVIEQICEVFSEAQSITLHRDGKVERFVCGDATFEVILDGFEKTIEGARQMPAFGVSLDNDTREAMKMGLWVEFTFKNTLFCNEMPFERLLIEVRAESQGINIARYNATAGYHGRCFFLDLNGTMSDFYKLINEI